jgi:hypothetical protein
MPQTGDFYKYRFGKKRRRVKVGIFSPFARFFGLGSKQMLGTRVSKHAKGYKHNIPAQPKAKKDQCRTRFYHRQQLKAKGWIK